MISLLNRGFDINLFENGADNLLLKLQDNKNYVELKERLEMIKDMLLSFTLPMPKIKKSLFHFLSPLKSRKKLIPKAILYPVSSASAEYIEFFLNEIDYTFEEAYFKKINVAFDETPGKDIITLIPVVLIPPDVNDAHIKKLEDKKYICLY
jgi:hypothetical protein